MLEPSPSSPHRRTVEEAIAQADAKERLRAARGVQASGVAMLLFGVSLLARWSTWRPHTPILGVHIHGGASFTLSLGAVVGGVAVVIGPIIYGVGQLLVTRAINVAASDPVTAIVVNQAGSGP